MTEQPSNSRPAGVWARLRATLRAELEAVTAGLSKIRQNRAVLKQLVRQDIWREIAADLPLRVKVSLVLVVILIGGVTWVQNSIFAVTPANFRENIAALQDVIRPPTPTAEPPVAGLESALAATTSVAQGSPTPEPLFVFHSVQEGESLISIAAHYDLTTEALLAANDIRDPTSLAPGQILLIPARDGLTRQKIVPHEVKAGDTLISIASTYGSSVKDIKAANPNLTDNTTTPGQVVAVPIVFTEGNPAVSPAEAAETQYHIVQSGEVPLTIAAQYDIPVEILLTANDITDPTRLQVGQQLTIPPHDGISLGYPVILYELLAGDTLIGIASLYGSSVKDILAVNPDLDPANFQVGEVVAIPVIFDLPKAPAAPAAPRTPPPPPPSLVDIAAQVVEFVNAERVAQGLAPFQVDEQVASVALSYAQDMYVHDFFAHVSPDGMTLRDRLRAGGVNDFASAGENIQRNTKPAGQTAKAAVDWFMNSRPHRNNILHERNNRIGVGVVEGPPGWYTFVLNFAQR